MKQIISGIIILLFLAGTAWAEERFFAVTAYNDFGESVYSEEVSTDVTRDVNKVGLLWGPVTEATGYNIYWGKASRQYGEGIDSGTTTEHEFFQCPTPTGIQINIETGEITLID